MVVWCDEEDCKNNLDGTHCSKHNAYLRNRKCTEYETRDEEEELEPELRWWERYSVEEE